MEIAYEIFDIYIYVYNCFENEPVCSYSSLECIKLIMSLERTSLFFSQNPFAS